MLGDTALNLFCAVCKSWVLVINLSGTLLKTKAKLVWNALLVSDWPDLVSDRPETIKSECLPLANVISTTLDKKP